jgi:hypothetical protein
MVKKSGYLLILAFFLVSTSWCQDGRSELLGREVIEKIAGEASGKVCFEHIRDLSVYSKWYGSDDMEKAAGLIAGKAGKYGLTDVRIERFRVGEDTYYGMQKPWYAWSCDLGELRIVHPFYELLASYEANTSCVLVNSRDGDVVAEVVWVGEGVDRRDYEGKEVQGKIVLASGDPDEVSRLAVIENGAAGILSGLALNRPGIPPNEVYQTTMRPWSDDRSKISTFGFSLSSIQTKRLLDLLQKGEKVVVQAKVRAQVRVPGHHQGVTAILPGTLYPEEEIILTAHLDHPRPGAHDNNSGCAMLLEVARIIHSLVENKILEAPKRTIRFYWTPHVWGCDMLFHKYPELLTKTMANINIDCVGLDQAKISSALTVISPPFSRASFLSDVFTSFLRYLTLVSNSSFGRAPFGPEIKDHDGSSNVFHGRTVPWVDYSDHVFFNSGSVGIPGVMLIDLPFGSHHSQNDEIGFLDPTELKRIAFLVTAVTYAIASAGPDEAPGMIDEVLDGGRSRLAAEMKLAKSLLKNAAGQELEKAWRSAEDLIAFGFAREKMALASTRVLTKNDSRAGACLEEARKKMEAWEREGRAELGIFSKAVFKEKGWKQGAFVLTAEEEELSRIVPARNPELKGTFGILNFYPQDKYQYRKYSPMMPYCYELLNYMDGKRNLLEIIRAVEAECLSSNYQVLSRTEAREFAGLLKSDGVVRY